ncbi:MAG: G5 domain-containing protein [Eubacterium sp.]|nr:G5 domain-containing protein [Eubacterium sp.]
MSKISNAAKSIAGNKVLAAVVSVILILSVFTSTVLADVPDQYDVKIVDSGETITVTTTETQPVEILNNAGITVNSNDIIDISNFNEGENSEIVISRLNTIMVEFEGHIQSYEVYSPTVIEAIKEIGLTLNEKDKINYSPDAKIQNGMVITIKSAFYVTLSADGEKVKYALTQGTVSDLLSLAGITLGEDDYTKPAADKELKAGMKVKVYRVEYKEETREEVIKYSTKKIKDKNLLETKKKVITKGENGSKDVKYSVKYVNGKEESKEMLSEVVTKEPVTKVVKIGTKRAHPEIKPNGVKSASGFTVGQKISGRYTHYCACATCNGSGAGVTSSGKRISNGMSNPYYIACNWLPLGSVIKTQGHYYTVVDRGGSGLSAVGRIDIFTPEGHAACYRYGTGSCEIEIVRLGW